MTPAPGGDWPDIDRLRAACNEAVSFYASELRRSAPARAYMAERGWSALTRPGAEADRWRPGYAPHRAQALVTHLRMAGFSESELLGSGLGRRAQWGVVDRFRDRVVLPLADDRSVIGFVGRALPGSPPEAPKWLNSPTTALYDKGRHLFGLQQNADRWTVGEIPVLVEGVGDAIAVGLAGRAAVAPLGTALTVDQLHALDQRVAPDRGVVVAFDSDAAGRRALLHAQQVLAGRQAIAVSLPDGADPGDYAEQGRVAALRSAVGCGRPLAAVAIDVRLDDWTRVLDHAAGQVNAVRDVAPLVLSDPRRAAALVSQVAERVHLAPRDVGALIVDTVNSEPATAPRAASPNPVRQPAAARSLRRAS